MSTILLATDGSPIAFAAIERAVALLGRDHRYISLAVVPPAYAPTMSVSPMETHPTLIDPILEQELDAEHRATSAEDESELDAHLGFATEHRVEMGEPGPTICDVAAEVGADLVVVGSHGLGWLQRVLLGSVSTHVLNHAPCPVLVARTDGRASA